MWHNRGKLQCAATDMLARAGLTSVLDWDAGTEMTGRKNGQGWEVTAKRADGRQEHSKNGFDPIPEVRRQRLSLGLMCVTSREADMMRSQQALTRAEIWNNKFALTWDLVAGRSKECVWTRSSHDNWKRRRETGMLWRCQKWIKYSG
jgi:hypothetical protein